MNNTLNTSLFFVDRSGKFSLIPSVREKCLEVCRYFLHNLQEDGISLNPCDIRMVGSNAGYDYTDSSDVDIHIVQNMQEISSDINLASITVNLEKSRFNQNHDIRIKNIPVELYVEDVRSSTDSNGIYSILYNRWIRYPIKQEDSGSDMYSPQLQQLLIQLREKISKTISSCDVSSIQALINQLYMIRKNGLETHGRSSVGNMLFKQIRREGLLQDLQNSLKKSSSNRLSLESKLRVFESSSEIQKICVDKLEEKNIFSIQAKLEKNVDFRSRRSIERLCKRLTARSEGITDIHLGDISGNTINLIVYAEDNYVIPKTQSDSIIEYICRFI